MLAFRYARGALLAGDAPEYYVMLEAFARHLSPDQRIGDADAVRTLFASHGVSVDSDHDFHWGFFAARDERWYCYHFWLYPLAALPAKLALRALGGDEFLAFAYTNAAALVATVFHATRRLEVKRLAFLGLSLVGPILWYLRWAHVEVFAVCLVVSSVVSAEERRWGRAALFAALGSMLAPPIVVLVPLLVLLAALDGRTGRWRRACTTAAWSAFAAVPALFYLVKFGHPNLILSTGVAQLKGITLVRVVSLFIDLDQGMLPYMPGTLLLGLVGLVLAGRHARVASMATLLGVLVMGVMCAQQTNYNAGCAGMIRYATWMVPILAWLATENVVSRWRAAGAAVAFIAIVVHGSIVLGGAGRDDSLEHHALAKAMLTRAPMLSLSDPEVFVERTTGTSLFDPWRPLPLPVAFFGPAGATKVLVDCERLSLLPERYLVDPEWFAALLRSTRCGSELVWIDPPPGTVNRRARWSHLVFEEGWSWVEKGGADQWRWSTGSSASVVYRTEPNATRTLRLRAVLPAQLAGRSRFTIRSGAELLDEADLQPGDVTRRVDVRADGNGDVRLSFTVSQTLTTEGRTIGFAFVELDRVQAEKTTLGAPHIRLVGDTWLRDADGVGEERVCFSGHGDVDVDVDVEARDLFVHGWLWPVGASKTRGDASRYRGRVRFFVDGALVKDRVVHWSYGEILALRRGRHRVRIEQDGEAQCVDGMNLR